MAEYDNRNRFTLFRNTKKREGKKDADFNGTFTDSNGVEYWISGWLKDSNGKKWMSLSFTKKEEQQGGQTKSEPAVSDDEIPF